MASQIFISYAYSDSAVVTKLAGELAAMGFVPWYAQSNLRLGHWRSKVEDAIDSASAVLIAVSNASAGSREVENEFRRAEAARKPIMPVLIEDCTLPLYAGSLHYASYHSDKAAALSLIKDLADTAAINRRSEELAYLARVRQPNDQRLRTYSRLAYRHVSEGVNASDVDSIVNIIANLDDVPKSLLDEDDLVGTVFESRAGKIPSRVAIVGEPGAGKTTTLVKLLSELADRSIESEDEPIPVYLSLKHFSGARPFVEYILDTCARDLGGLRNHFAELLASTRLALLFDGLNEIPKEGDADARLREIRAFLQKNPNIFIAATCLSVDDSIERNLRLDICQISPLSPIQIRRFVRKQCRSDEEADQIFWSLIKDAQAKNHLDDFRRAGGTDEVFWTFKGRDRPVPSYFSWELWLAVRDDPLSLLTLARNPYLLTIIVQILRSERKPDSVRYELFSTFFAVLCEIAHRSSLGVGDIWIEPDAQRDLFARLAQEMLRRGVNSLPTEDALGLLGEAGPRFLKLAEKEKILECSGDVAFSHQLLRAYFASSYIEQVWLGSSAVEDFPSPKGWWHLTGWEEPIVFLVGKHARDPVRLLSWLRDVQPELASRCLIESGCQAAEPVLQSLATAWIMRLQSGSDAPPGRAAIGRALGRLNRDLRPGVSLVDGNGLPVIEWIHIPARRVKLNGASSPVNVEPFEMSKYLITNAHFAPFIEDGGYTEKHRSCWTRTGWDWKLLAERASPDNYTEIFRLSNHPRIGTVWYEVFAYSQWLTKRLRDIGEIGSDTEIRIPTEVDWEAAARGPEGLRLYPWGDDFSYDLCNVRDIRSTTAVGIYPAGATPEGVCDMIGNAWSWCLTKWNNDPTVQDNEPEGDDLRVYRGGSWAYDFNVSRWKPEELRADQRFWITPLDDRPDAIGFFLVKGRCSPT